MADERSIFHEDWRACLRAHYMHVIRINDAVTEPTLHSVLARVGFSDDEIKQMAVEAKMRDTDASLDELPGLD